MSEVAAHVGVGVVGDVVDNVDGDGDVVADVPRGNADPIDQLTRSAESVVRNIAEGAGRWSDADRQIVTRSREGRPWSAPRRWMS